MKINPRMSPLMLALVGLWVAHPSLPVLAQEKIQDEAARSDFIYRVNLGRADDVKLLIRQGASPNQLSGEGVPVLCLAAGRYDPEGINVVQALLEAGANIQARDSKGQTALFYAAKAGNLAAIEYLMENKLDSYALDNNGDVARNAAYKAGQLESVKAIDDFILRQTAEITKAYKQRNQALANLRNRPAPQTPLPLQDQPDDNVQQYPPQPKPEPTPGTSYPPVYPPEQQTTEETPSESSDVPEETISIAAPTEETPAPQTTAEPELPAQESATSSPTQISIPGESPEASEARIAAEKEETASIIYDMAFNVCAFQYWSYCSSARQSVDLDREELLVAISSSKAAAEKGKKTLHKVRHLKLRQVESIATSAQKRIYKELNSMASNRDRHEKGVGKRDDMRQRCELIARQWGEKAPEIRPRSSENSSNKGAKRAKNGKEGSFGKSSELSPRKSNAYPSPGGKLGTK